MRLTPCRPLFYAVDEVHGHGIKKLLEIIPEKDLEGFGVETVNEDKTKVKREALRKKIFAAMQEGGPAKYLEKLESSFLNSLFDTLVSVANAALH